MNKLFYIFFIKVLEPGAKIISPFNRKASLWINGRKGIFKKIETALTNVSSKKIWMHCASLGEFEQGLPLLEKLKTIYPEYKFVLTFFSPSGYEVQKKNKQIDFIFYLPVDSKKNAEKFLDLIQPHLILFVKYEYWYYYLKEIHKRNIPLILASGNFLPHFAFFRWYGSLFRQMLQYFTYLFVQNNSALQLLKSINVTNVSISGDTRFDRVLQVAENKTSYPEIEQFISGKKIVIAGSTWLRDDEKLCDFVNAQPELRFIIAPHDISQSRINECSKYYKHSILYSAFKKNVAINGRIAANINAMIIDNTGLLKFLYRYATICYVGGGFASKGIHNILEAAVYFKPVLFGPEYKNSSEAIELINKGGAFNVKDTADLEQQLAVLLSSEKLYNAACKISGNYVRNNLGATDTIINYIRDNHFLND